MFNKLYSELKGSADPKKADKMSAYMRDQFLYLGVPAPERPPAEKSRQHGFLKEGLEDT